MLLNEEVREACQQYCERMERWVFFQQKQKPMSMSMPTATAFVTELCNRVATLSFYEQVEKNRQSMQAIAGDLRMIKISKSLKAIGFSDEASWKNAWWFASKEMEGDRYRKIKVWQD